MAEFCTDCPNKGNCEGDIESVRILNAITYGTVSNQGRTASISIERGVPQGPTDMTVQYVDANGGTSDTFVIRGNSYPNAEAKVREQLVSIGACAKPNKRRRFLGLGTKAVCGSVES